MSASDVMMAYSQHCRDLSDKEVASLVAKGVPEDALGFSADGGRQFRLRAMSVFWDGIWFQIGHGGQRCIAIVCRDERGDVADIVVWVPQDDRIGLWSGMTPEHRNVSMIGEEICTLPRLDGDKLWIRDGVLDWLIHHRTGVVILNADLARPLLTAASPVVVKSKAHKERLEAAWRAPRIQVIDDGIAASTTEAVA